MTDTICILSGARAGKAGSTRWPAKTGLRPAGDRGGPNMARSGSYASTWGARRQNIAADEAGGDREALLRRAPPATPSPACRSSALMSALGSSTATPLRAAAAAAARARSPPVAAARAAAPSLAHARARFAPALARQPRRTRAVAMASQSPQGAWLRLPATALRWRSTRARRLVAALARARASPRRAPHPGAPTAPRRCRRVPRAHARACVSALPPLSQSPPQPQRPAPPTQSSSPRPDTAARCTGSSRWATSRRRWTSMSARSA